MSKIRILSDHTINKIAAGEVIENPASVVKELVENAIDAGATDISVEIKTGGRQLIRISDNGCGMSKDDALLCLERHATSKIKEVEDIQDIFTMGFRGEAVPSIAAISKFTILTSTQEAKSGSGTLVMVEGGNILSCGPAARSPGTTVEVKSLFFNVPVRKKFQKSPSYDTQEILKMMSVIALGNPGVRFELISDQKQILKTNDPSNLSTFSEKLAERVQSVLGAEFFSAAKPISLSKDPYQIEGFIGKPSFTRHNRSGQYLFINQRPVYSPLVAFAIRDGYGTMLAANRHPVFALHLCIPGHLVDVNVHPQKKEVRLRQEYLLKEHLIAAVQKAFQRDHSDPLPWDLPIESTDSFCSEPMKAHYEVSPVEEEIRFPKIQFKEAFENVSYSEFKAPVLASSSLPSKIPKYDLPLLFPESLPAKTPPKVITTMVGFIQIDPAAFGMQDGLCLIDQKAASLRIHYERLLGNQTDCDAKQPLLIPLTLDFSAYEASLLQLQLPRLNQMGFGIQEFGQGTFLIDAIPEPLEKEDVKECLMKICQELSSCGSSELIKKEKLRRMALAASRLAESSSKRLSFDEAQSLVNQLVLCDAPLQCPFGKPTFIHLSHEKLQQLRGGLIN